jgi:hypothetical protein
MLDPRVYRAAFAPLLLALVIAAFSLGDRPRPIQTTLAPDAFDGPRAFATLQRLVSRFPDRRPGDAGDEGVAAAVARSFRGSFCNRGKGCSGVVIRRFGGDTIAGDRTIETVMATRLGAPGPGIVVVAHRDAAGRGGAAELSGTAALVELGRVFGGRQTRRTLTLVSTSGGSGGAAGARQLAGDLPAGDPQPDAVVVLGDLASQRLRRPFVLPWSSGGRLAPLRLRRTAEAAVRAETGEDAGGPHAITQLSRLAFPFALGEQGAFDERGIPAVELQASGERGPSLGAPVSADRLRGFGRAALRTIDSLDNGPTLTDGPQREVVARGKTIPSWAFRLVVAALLLPALLGGIDALARVRRRHVPVGVWVRWVLSLALPFVLALGLARLLGAVGLIDPAPADAVVAGRVPADGVAIAVVGLVFVLGCLALAPIHRALGVPVRPDGAGPGAAVGLTAVVLACAVWLFNPFAAAVLVLPAHLWLVAPELRMRRGAAIALVLAALLPVAIVLGVYAQAVGASLVRLPWSLLLLVAGRQVGVLAMLAVSVLGGCALAALRLALREPDREAPAVVSPPLFGPVGYSGLGGADSRGGGEPAVRARR